MTVTVISIVVGAILAILLILWLFGERWRPLRLSTLNMMREHGLRGILNFNALHGYIYSRWTKKYINLALNHILPRMGPRSRKRLADHYHGKVLTHEHARAIITIDREIPLQDLEQIIPYPVARDLVIKGPPDVAVYECCCRHARTNPCQPTRVCMVIGQPFVDFILEHNPRTSRRITQTEALELLEKEHGRGHLHSAWFKDAMLERFYAICNCCKCCCGGIETMVKYGTPMVASSGFVARVDDTKCASCETCVDSCPFEAVEVDRTAVVNGEKCMGCGVCVGQCPNEAMSLVRDERKGEPLDVRLLVQK
ncbi:4Fe-4S binding protein [Candidatus Latescibacterota bacterium]